MPRLRAACHGFRVAGPQPDAGGGFKAASAMASDPPSRPPPRMVMFEKSALIRKKTGSSRPDPVGFPGIGRPGNRDVSGDAEIFFLGGRVGGVLDQRAARDVAHIHHLVVIGAEDETFLAGNLVGEGIIALRFAWSAAWYSSVVVVVGGVSVFSAGLSWAACSFSFSFFLGAS